MQVGVDYKFRDDLFDEKEEGATVPIELLLEDFKGIVYRYTTVSFKMDGEIPKMLYDYEIMKSDTYSMITLRKSQKFNTILGLILNMMLLDLGDAEEHETGNNDPKKPDPERGVCKEGSTIPQE